MSVHAAGKQRSRGLPWFVVWSGTEIVSLVLMCTAKRRHVVNSLATLGGSCYNGDALLWVRID